MSKPVTVDIPHQLGRVEARRRVEDGFGDVSRHLGGAAGALTTSWTGDRMTFSLHAMGQGVSGVVDISDDVVRIDVLLPAFLAMIAGKVKGTLQKEGQLLLAKRSSAT